MFLNKPLFFMLLILSFTVSGCQLLFPESNRFLKDPNVNTAITVEEKPPPAVSPDPDHGSKTVDPDIIMPPAAALDKSLPLQPAEQPDSSPSLAADRTETVRLLHNEADNAETIFTGQTITEDLVFNGTVLVEGSLVVAPQATLWVDAGSKIFFAADNSTGEKAQLMVMGRLVVQGNAHNPVLFSSAFEKPVAGDWTGVLLLDSTKNNLIEFLEITGAQTGIAARQSRLTVVKLQLDNCFVSMDLQDSTVTIDEVMVKQCDAGVDSVKNELPMGNALESAPALRKMD